MRIVKEGISLEEFREMVELISKKYGRTLRIVMPGEEETTDKATITFVKDLKKSGISRPEQEAQAGQEQGVSAGDRGRDTGHHEEPGSEQGGSRADSGQSLVEDTSTSA